MTDVFIVMLPFKDVETAKSVAREMRAKGYHSPAVGKFNFEKALMDEKAPISVEFIGSYLTK